MVKREARMEEEDEGAVAHDFRAQARARASPSSTKLWDSTERVHLTVSVCLYPLQPVSIAVGVQCCTQHADLRPNTVTRLFLGLSSQNRAL